VSNALSLRCCVKETFAEATQGAVEDRAKGAARARSRLAAARLLMFRRARDAALHACMVFEDSVRGEGGF